MQIVTTNLGVATALIALGIAASARADENGQPGQTKVMVIATHHFVTDMTDGYTPGHLRALLQKFDPDVLLVEAPSNVPEPWKEAPVEVSAVLKPWAEQHRVEITPCGLFPTEYQEQVNQFIRSLAESENTKKYHEIEQRFQQQIAAQPPTCRYMNSDVYQQVWRLYQTELAKLTDTPTPWHVWNTKILSNILKACEAQHGKRVAIVFGGAHAYFLRDGLTKETTIELVDAKKFLPLPKQDVSKLTEPSDYLRALRPLNLDVLPPPQIEHVRPLLEHVKTVPEYAGDYQLFLGKLKLHEGRPKEALAAFEQLGTVDRHQVAKFDNRTKLFETGLVYSALALFQMGERETAKQRLENVIKDRNFSEPCRDWAKQVSKNLSLGE